MRALLAMVLLSSLGTLRAADRQDVGSVDALEVTSLTRERIALWARAVLPKAAKGSKQKFTGKVLVANVPIPVKSPVLVVVQAQPGRNEAVFFLDLVLEDTPEALLSRVGTSAIDLTLDGRLSGDAGSKVTIFAVGVLRFGTPDIKAPASFVQSFARFGGARFKGLTLSETSGEATVVLYNPFRFDLPVKNVTYSVHASDRRLGGGSKTGFLIRGGRENEIALPIAASNSELISAAGTAVLGGGAIEGRLVGSISLKVGRDEITVPVNLPGAVRVSE
jgi:LEA14-like dessication related protein